MGDALSIPNAPGTNHLPEAREGIPASDIPHASVESPQIRWEATVEGQRARLAEIARALEADEQVPAVTVRVFLSWFWWSQRRGRFIVSHIRELLIDTGLETVPDFESAYLDAEMSFALASEHVDLRRSDSPETAKVSEVTDRTDNRASSPTFADPTYRISKLAAANRKPVSVKPDSSLVEAITLMMANDYSQLPVMVGEHAVKGMVSWESIGTRLALGQSPRWVREVMDPHSEISSDDSLFTAIPSIVERGYALVRAVSDNRIVGIITTTDLSLQFQQLSEPFLLLGEIENHMRRIIDARFKCEDLAAIKDPSDPTRSIESVADLTFGEYKRLIEEPSRWSLLKLDLDRAVFVELLDKVRGIRNDVMHFDPDGIEEKALTVLREFAKFLRTLQTIGAT